MTNTPQSTPSKTTTCGKSADKVECRECGGTGVIPAGIDREAGRDPGRDCWKCHGYGEHVR